MSEVAAAQPAPAPAAPPAAPAEVVTDQKPIADSAPAPAPANETPENKAADQEKRSGSRRFERRISQAIRRAAEARAEADVLRKQLEELKPKAPADSGAPNIRDFEDVEKYAEAREKYAREQERKTYETERQTKAQREEMEVLTSSWEKKAERGEGKYEDWDEIVGELKPSSPLHAAIMEADNGEDIAHYLGTHIDEANRIVALSPRAQVREIGKLETKLAAEPPKPKAPSKAPAPITPITGTKAAEVAEVKDGMSYQDFVKVRNRQLGRGK